MKHNAATIYTCHCKLYFRCLYFSEFTTTAQSDIQVNTGRRIYTYNVIANYKPHSQALYAKYKTRNFRRRLNIFDQKLKEDITNKMRKPKQCQ
jgi:hypothetical protein